MFRAEDLAKYLRETDMTVTAAMQRVGWRYPAVMPPACSASTSASPLFTTDEGAHRPHERTATRYRAMPRRSLVYVHTVCKRP